MLGMTDDLNHSVRAAAVRALGSFVLFDSIQEDHFFLTDLSLILVSMLRDSNIHVQIKSSWVIREDF